jgi:hypothetical protein
MQNSSKPKSKRPQKLCADFRLFAHATRRPAEEIEGKLCCFGP